MSETNRNLQGIDKAGQKGAWDRPLNPSQKAGKMPVADTKKQSSWPKPSLNNSGDGLQAVDKDNS